MKNNLKIYNLVRKVPDEAQKAFNNGSFSGTDINPQWRIQMLTEAFGPAGIGWYYEIAEHWNENIGAEIHTHVRIRLYIKEGNEWSKPIEGLGGNKSLQVFKSGPKASDEGYKMALTDALSVACKALGIGADIYFAKGDSKYVQETSNADPIDVALYAISQAESRADLTRIWKTYPNLQTNVQFSTAIQKAGEKFPK